jgi:hypothetical protein
MAHQQLGLAQLQKIEADVTDFGVVEQAPKMEGRQMGMLLGPKKKKFLSISKNAAETLRFFIFVFMGD